MFAFLQNRETIWFLKEKEDGRMIKKQKLINELNQFKRKIFIWETIGIGMNATVQEKELAVQSFLTSNKDYNFYEVCKTIHLNKGTYFHYINDKVEKKSNIIKDELLKPEIKSIFEESWHRYGHKKISVVLRSKGYVISEAKISRLMKELDLKVAINKQLRKAPEPGNNIFLHSLLGRRFIQQEPNAVWVSGILELNIHSSTFYLCALMDLFSRMIVAWRVAPKRSSHLALPTFKDAFENRNEPKDLLVNSDQGAEYTSYNFISTLRMLKVKQSFSNPGTPYDNAVMESFYSILRREEIHLHQPDYSDYDTLKKYMDEYMNFYNNKRIHKTLGYLTPVEYEKKWHSIINMKMYAL